MAQFKLDQRNICLSPLDYCTYFFRNKVPKGRDFASLEPLNGKQMQQWGQTVRIQCVSTSSAASAHLSVRYCRALTAVPLEPPCFISTFQVMKEVQPSHHSLWELSIRRTTWLGMLIWQKLVIKHHKVFPVSCARLSTSHYIPLLSGTYVF